MEEDHIIQSLFMDVIASQGIEKRRIHHRELIGGMWVSVPEINDDEELFWAMASITPTVIKVR